MTLEFASEFPVDDARFYIAGPTGRLEVIFNGTADVQPEAFAVICHPHPLHGGTMQNKVVHTLAKTFSQSGIAALRFNFRGVGQSEGQYDNAIGELDDLGAVIDWCRSRLPQARLYLAGFSFGAYVALQALQQQLPHQLILLAPPLHMFDFTALPPPTRPVLLVQGEKDEIVDSTQVRQWGESMAGFDVQMMPDCGHFFHGQLNQLQQLISKHIQR